MSWIDKKKIQNEFDEVEEAKQETKIYWLTLNKSTYSIRRGHWLKRPVNRGIGDCLGVWVNVSWFDAEIVRAYELEGHTKKKWTKSFGLL